MGQECGDCNCPAVLSAELREHPGVALNRNAGSDFEIGSQSFHVIAVNQAWGIRT
jgi:hypothetical protein